MQSRSPSSMRGASVIGVILLLALLSTAAIALDGAPIGFGAQSQVAATLALEPNNNLNTSSTPTDQSTQAQDGISQKCQLGYDYIVRFDDKTKKVTIQPAFENSKGGVDPVTEAQANVRCNPPMTADNKPKTVLDTRGTRQCNNEWVCRVYMCVSGDLTVDGKEKCPKYVQSVKMGDDFTEKDYKSRVAEGIKEDVKTVSPEKAGQIAGNAGKLDPAYSQALFGSQEQQEERRTELKNEINQAEQQLAAWAPDEECRLAQLASKVPGNMYPCPTKLDLERKLEDLQREQQMLDALAKNQTSLQPPSPDDKGGLSPNNDIKTGGDDKRPPPDQRPDPRDRWTGGPPYNPYDDYLGRNSYSQAELQAACRMGSQQACQALAGYGLQPYGTNPYGSPQCGSTFGGGGGLIGTIVSLFMRNNNSNNNNCVNGVPRPQCTITASPQNITNPGQAVQLSWQSQSAFSASLSNAGNVPTQGNMTVNPQTTTTYNLFVQGYRDNYGQQTSGQCSVQVTVGNQGGGADDPSAAPKAQISCSPLVADVGMSVAVSYACTNANTSVGNGFATNGQLSGSATPTVQASTLGSNTVTYGITCSKAGKTDTAQCTVNVNKTSIVLVANPKNVRSGEEANIGWVTGGMDQCVVSSPTLPGFTAENANNTSVSGVAKTPELTEDTEFVLTCTTQSGGTKTAKTIVEVD